MRAYFLAIGVLAGAIAGCARDSSSHNADESGARPVQLTQTPVQRGAAARRSTIASLPDRGELIAYEPSAGPIKRSGSTWHPVQVSEEHALRAITTGTLTFETPSGHPLRIRYQRHIEHPNGNWTWIGRSDDAPLGRETVLTFGEKAVFGSIPHDDHEALKLTIGGGRVWLVQNDRKTDARDTAPKEPDFLVPGGPAPGSVAGVADGRRAVAAMRAENSHTSSHATVDLLVGYTEGFAANLGGDSQALTRIAHLVDLANQAYSASGVDGRLRVVRAIKVNYPDATSNRTALYELTGVQCTAGTGSSLPDQSLNCTRVGSPAALQPLAQARDTFGADVVTLLRRFESPESQSCGLGWLLGAGQREITNADAAYAMSVISDTSSEGTCRDDTLAHEIGHNMGLQHNREAAQGTDDTNGDGNLLDPEEYGRFPYSFGYSTGTGSGNFYTVMSVRRTGQVGYLVFSNPSITTCGGLPCGVADQADNARALRLTMPIIAGFRATVVADDNAPLGRLEGMGGKCLDAADRGTANGTPIQVWSCNGEGQQLWSLTGSDGSFRGFASGRAIDVVGYGSTNGSRLQLWDALGGANQSWTFLNTAIVSVATGRVLDVVGMSSTNGARLQVWSDLAGQNQRWTFDPVSGAIRGIGGKCLDVAAWGTAPGTPVQIWDCTGDVNQRWRLQAGGALVGHGGNCLEAADSASYNGASVRMAPCNGSAGQRWRLVGQIRSKLSGLCLDDPAYGAQDGSRVHIWSCHGGANQRWSYAW